MMRISKLGVTGLQVMSLCAFILYQPSVLANENWDGSNDFFRQPSLPKYHQERAQAREGGGERSLQLSVTTNDSYNALLALYLATNGASWTDSSWSFLGEGSTDYCNFNGVTCVTITIDNESYISLTELDVSGFGLDGTIPTEMFDSSTGLINLLYLDVSNNLSLRGTIPDEIGNIANLETLLLSNNSLTSSIPEAFSLLTNLSRLDLGNTQITGSIQNIIACTNLEYLSLSNSPFSGSLPSAILQLTSLRELEIGDTLLSWMIPDDIGSTLVSLEVLIMDNNYRFSGTLPPSLGQLTALRVLEVDDTSLYGSLPTELGNLSNLEYLSLEYALFSSKIPTEIGSMTALTDLYLDGNSFIGPLPTEVGHLTSLKYFSISRNYDMDGMIPTEIGSCTSLIHLKFSRTALTGQLPAELGNLTSLKTLDTHRSSLSGSIPTEIGQMISLEYLRLSYADYTGSLPSEIGHLSLLVYLSIENSSWGTSLPTELGLLSSLATFYSSSSNLHGNIPTELGQLSTIKYLDFNHNNFNGTIPTELGMLASLISFQFWDNPSLSGTIPTYLGMLNSLTYFAIDETRVSGSIPSELLNNLLVVHYYLCSNFLSGSLPHQFFALNDIYLLFTKDTNMVGSIPTEISSMLAYLDMSNASFSGTIPVELSSSNNMLYVHLSNNDFSGTLPQLYSSSIYEFSASRNNLIGTVPNSLFLSNMDEIDLSHNNLSGYIPSSFASALYLMEIDLSYNNLSGYIPNSFASALHSVKLHANNLSGTVTCNFDFLVTADCSEGEVSCDCCECYGTPSTSPSILPTFSPSVQPTDAPSRFHSVSPSELASKNPSSFPSERPNISPSISPTNTPTLPPSNEPSLTPTHFSSHIPSISLSEYPSNYPSGKPSVFPSKVPSNHPSVEPSVTPSILPIETPSSFPSNTPSTLPTLRPTTHPTTRSSNDPTLQPSNTPSQIPSGFTDKSSSIPSHNPSTSFLPSLVPTLKPSYLPSYTPLPSISRKISSVPTLAPIIVPISSTLVSISISGLPAVLSDAAIAAMENILLGYFGTNAQGMSIDSVELISVGSSNRRRALFRITAVHNLRSLQASVVPLTFRVTAKIYQDAATTLYEVCSNTIASNSENMLTDLRKADASLSAIESLVGIDTSSMPSEFPSLSNLPSLAPSLRSSEIPSFQLSSNPSEIPSKILIFSPNPTSSSFSLPPFSKPSSLPTVSPTNAPSISRLPSRLPSTLPNNVPTTKPSRSPSSSPTAFPSLAPSLTPPITSSFSVPYTRPVNMTYSDGILQNETEIQMQLADDDRDLMNYFLLTYGENCSIDDCRRDLNDNVHPFIVEDVHSYVVNITNCTSLGTTGRQLRCYEIDTNVTITRYPVMFSQSRSNLIVLNTVLSFMDERQIEYEPLVPVPKTVTTKISITFSGVSSEEMDDDATSEFVDTLNDFLEERLGLMEPPILVDDVIFDHQTLSVNVTGYEEQLESRLLKNAGIRQDSNGANFTNTTENNELTIFVTVVGEYLPPPEVDFDVVIVDVFDEDGREDFIVAIDESDNAYFEPVIQRLKVKSVETEADPITTSARSEENVFGTLGLAGGLIVILFSSILFVIIIALLWRKRSRIVASKKAFADLQKY